MTSTQPCRLLFVGNDQAWQAAATTAAQRLGCTLDVQPDLEAALADMLPPGRAYSHVLAVAPLRSTEMDALAGMVDEVTLKPTPLLLLGCMTSGTAAHMPCIVHPDADALTAALQTERVIVPPGEPPMAFAELAETVHGGGLRMRFQPILSADSLEPIGLEALARLHHPKRGIMHPKDFIPLSAACGRDRLLAGIAAARTFLEIGPTLRGSLLFVTLNLPLEVVMAETAVRRGLELCAVADVKPSQIMMEVLETSTAPDLNEVRDALARWRAAGFRVVIDDAGPALPHWRTLLDLPFDALKLDGSMVGNPAEQGLLRTITAEARARNRFIVAEGVEDQACLDRVRALGVDAVQGFMFSRPLPALAVPIWLERWKARPAG